MKTLEITLTAAIPDDNEEIGHEAIVACKVPVAAGAAVLEKLGLKVEHSRRLVNRQQRAKKEEAAAPKLVA